MTAALIVLGIVAGYIAAVPLFARAFYIMLANKEREVRFEDGGGALSVASLWPISIWIILLMWIFAVPIEPGRRSVRRWIERPTPMQRRVERRKAAEREQRRLLAQARAKGLPVDVSELP